MRLIHALSIAGLLMSGAAFAQLLLESMPVRVGGYILDEQAQPVALRQRAVHRSGDAGRA